MYVILNCNEQLYYSSRTRIFISRSISQLVLEATSISIYFKSLIIGLFISVTPSINIYNYPSIIEIGYLLTQIRETRRCDALLRVNKSSWFLHLPHLLNVVGASTLLSTK